MFDVRNLDYKDIANQVWSVRNNMAQIYNKWTMCIKYWQYEYKGLR